MIFDAGCIDYEECCALQKNLVKRRRLGETGDSVILAEHDSIFTIGRTGDMSNLLVAPLVLSEKGLKVLRVDRGGDITYHGPGQLVAYPIIDLKKCGRNLHGYMRDLEEVVIRFLCGYSVHGERVDNKTGVWVSGEKIASIGIGASNWVTFHGLSVNINCDLDFFAMINPCGMGDIKMTSLEKIKGYKVGMGGAKSRMLVHFKEIFGVSGGAYNYAKAGLA